MPPIIHLEGPPGTKTKCGLLISALPAGETCISFSDTGANCPECILVWEKVHERPYARSIINPITRHFSRVCEALSLVDPVAVERTVEILKTVRAAGGTVWLAGNGGSAATASHFANDLTKMAKVKALAVSDFTATTLAYGNDDGWEQMFANALEVHIGFKDAVLGISCSGNSKNIISFLSAARTRFKIGFTGPDQSLMGGMGVDVLVRAMANEITVQEDVHSIVCHAIAGALRNA